MKEEFPVNQGTYALVFKCKKKQEVKVGKLGIFQIVPGYYIYIGSAFGPGGIKARVGRHLKKHKKLKWHVDYLRKYLKVVDVYFSTSEQKLECVWSAKLAELEFSIPFIGFGSSDCKCKSHLFYFKEWEPQIKRILQI